MDKKGFKLNASELLITDANKETEKEITVNDLPRGFKVVEESKSARLQLLVKPSTKEELKKIANRQATSLNDLINKILEKYLNEQ